MNWFVIPARMGSTRFPGKNRLLLPYTLATLSEKDRETTILTTDDPELMELGREAGVCVLRRPGELATNETSMKRVLEHVCTVAGVTVDDKMIVLYPTYPGRTSRDIAECMVFLEGQYAASLLCAKPLVDHPYMCYRHGDGYTGVPVIEHNFYRVQDYPECFQMCHLVCIFQVGVLPKLNSQLRTQKTLFYPLSRRPYDIDTEEDFARFLRETQCT